MQITLKTGLEISWDKITLMDMLFLLSNNRGYIDGDRKVLVITGGIK